MRIKKIFNSIILNIVVISILLIPNATVITATSVPGDVDMNGRITSVDIAKLVDFVESGGQDTTILCAVADYPMYLVDMNSNGVVNSVDIAILVDLVESGDGLGVPVVTLSSNVDSIVVSWSTVTGADSYEVYRSTSRDGSYVLIYTTGARNYDDDEVVKGEEYYYKVRAVGTGSGETIYSEFSAVKSAKIAGSSLIYDSFLDGSEIGRTKQQIIDEVGMPTKSYVITGGEIMVYNTTYNPITYVIIKNNIAVELYSSDSTKVDSLGIKVGEGWDSVSSKLIAKFGAGAVNLDSSKRAITVAGHDANIVIIEYHFSFEKVEAFRYTASGVLCFEATLLNEPAGSELIADLTSAYRFNHGVPYAVTTTAAHNKVASDYSKYMLVNNHFDHIDLQGKGPGDRAAAGGINFRTCGENIAAGHIHPTDTFYQWVHSTGHRANILNPNFRKIGVGAAFKTVHGGPGLYLSYYTQLFTD